MAPPVAAYTSEVALASVESSLAGGSSAAAQAAAAAKAIEEKRALLARSAAELDEEARKRAEQVGAAGVGMYACHGWRGLQEGQPAIVWQCVGWLALGIPSSHHASSCWVSGLTGHHQRCSSTAGSAGGGSAGAAPGCRGAAAGRRSGSSCSPW